MRARASLLLAAFLFPFTHPLVLLAQNQSPPSSSPQLGSAEYPLCLFPATKAEHDPAAMALLSRVIATGLVRLPNSPAVSLRGTTDKYINGAVVASWPFHVVQAKGHVKIHRKVPAGTYTPSRHQSSSGSSNSSASGSAESGTQTEKKRIAHFGRSVGDLLPILSVNPSSLETSSVTMVSTNGNLATIRVAPVDRSFSLFAQKKAGPIVDLTVNTETAVLVRAMVRPAGCEHTDVFARRLEFSGYGSAHGRMRPSTITVMQGDNKFVYHIQSVRVTR